MYTYTSPIMHAHTNMHIHTQAQTQTQTHTHVNTYSCPSHSQSHTHRYHRRFGREVYFLTGTDEHGKKIDETARGRGVSGVFVSLCALCTMCVCVFILPCVLCVSGVFVSVCTMCTLCVCALCVSCVFCVSGVCVFYVYHVCSTLHGNDLLHV